MVISLAPFVASATIGMERNSNIGQTEDCMGAVEGCLESPEIVEVSYKLISTFQFYAYMPYMSEVRWFSSFSV